MSTTLLNRFIAQISGKVPLRIMIVIPFVILVTIAGGLTGYLSLRNGQEAVNNVAMQLRNEITARIQERVKNYLETAHLVNELHVNTISLEQIALNDTKSLERYFWKQIQTFSEVTNTFIGLPDGRFVGGRQFRNGEPQIILADESTNGGLNYYDADAQGNRTVVVEGEPNYDPRGRGWYKTAKTKGEAIWTNVYSEFTTKSPAITAAQPVYDKNHQFVGVVGSTAMLTDVSEFLSGLKIGKSGQTFIVERNGQLVAYSGQIGQKATERIKATAEDNSNVLIRETAKHLEAQYPDLLEINDTLQQDFILDGARQFLQVTPLKDTRGIDWLIVVTIPEADFMEQIDDNTRMTIWLSLISLALTTLIGLFTARGIIQPVLNLNNATKRFAEGHWDQKLPTERTDELGDLARSFNSMGDQVKKSFNALENVNATLEEKVKERTKDLAKALDELKNSQAQLVQSEKMASLGQMVAGVAHEINTPLGYVRSNIEMTRDLFSEVESLTTIYDKLIEMLLTEGTNEEELSEQLTTVTEMSQNFRDDDTFNETKTLYDDIIHGLDQIADLVLNLKDFSRVDSVRVQNVSLNECIDSVLVIGHNVIASKVAVFKQYADTLPPVECSPSHINQVLLNILTNAAQAIDDKTQGKIVVTTRADDKNVYVEIEDNGKGIPEDVRAKIFDPFFTTKPIGEGTGLGLSISYQIIEQHHGHIDVASTIGKGTKFTITLPRQSTKTA